MRSIVLANQKGGVGKTTTAVSLAAALSELGKSVLIVDMDPQANATNWLGAYTSDALWDCFLEGKPLAPAITETNREGVQLIPGCPGLVGVQRELANDPGALEVLRKALKRLPPYDLLLIDTPPSLSLLLLNALGAADEALVCVETRALAICGLVDLIESLDAVRDQINRKLAPPWLVCTRKVRTRLSREIEEGIREEFGARVLEATIREATRIAEAPAHQQDILRYAPSSAVAQDYRDLALEVLTLKEHHGERRRPRTEDDGAAARVA